MTNKKVVIIATAACVSLGSAFAAYWEGKSNAVYRDPLGIPTACYGATGPDIHLGQVYSDEECLRRLDADYLKFWNGVSEIVHVPMQPWEHMAFTDLAYNAGLQTFLHSSMARLANRGDFAGACAALKLYIYGTDSRSGQKIMLPGLVRRREAEYELCVGRNVEL